jgi:D-glycero-D-manno-heptose 1,7-bisphosphate phosphatase
MEELWKNHPIRTDENWIVMLDTELVIFDVDGTLTTTKSGETFRKTADDWQWLPNRVAKCKQLVKQEISLAIASNQAGVAFPWSSFTQAQIQVELDKTAQEIGATFVAACYSSPNPKARSEYFNANDERRKPNGGMLFETMQHFGKSAEQTLFVGDRPEDEQAARAAGVGFMWAWQFFGDEKPE